MFFIKARYLQIAIIMLLPFTLVAQEVVFESSHLPLIKIDTGGQEIVDDPRIVAHMGIINNGPEALNFEDDPFNDFDGRIAIELRGSSSSTYPKKQYRLETQDELGENLNISLLGLPRENDWILYGPYDDQSLIRNVLAFDLSREIGRYASRTRFCELFLNGDYRGIYVLMEKLKRDDGRIDIANLRAGDTTGLELTGGYIIKIDKIEGENTAWWESSSGVRYQYDDPDYDELNRKQRDYIQEFMEQVEEGFDDIETFNPLVDLEAAVDHFILNELAKNVDAYRISSFMYKDRDDKNPRLVFGPVWDFNLSFGKAWYSDDLYVTEGWQTDYSIRKPWDGFRVPFYWEEMLLNDPFYFAVKQRWAQLRDGIFSEDSLFGRIDALVLELGDAVERNFQRWPESAGEHSYGEEVTKMKAWLRARLDWIDSELDYVSAVSDFKSPPDNFELLTNYPNPFNSSTTIRWRQSKPARVEITLYDMRGRMINVITNSQYPAGGHGESFDASDLASGVYFYRLQAAGFAGTKKMLLIR